LRTKKYLNIVNPLQEAEGWPSWVVTEEDAQKHIKNIADREKIFLDPSKIAKNPGKRALAKLMLNSFWGKVKNNSFCLYFHRFKDIFSLVREII